MKREAKVQMDMAAGSIKALPVASVSGALN